MSLFSDPAEHAAHPPESWQVIKRAERLWGLYVTAGSEQPLQSFTTRREAEEHKTRGFWVNLYERDGRWMAGQTPPGMKPYAQVCAERERNKRAQALFATFRAAGYKGTYLDGPGKLCSGGREPLPEDRPAWADSDGWLWCRDHLAAHLAEPGADAA